MSTIEVKTGVLTRRPSTRVIPTFWEGRSSGKRQGKSSNHRGGGELCTLKNLEDHRGEVEEEGLSQEGKKLFNLADKRVETEKGERSKNAWCTFSGFFSPPVQHLMELP